MRKRVTYDRKYRTVTTTLKFVVTDEHLRLLRLVAGCEGQALMPHRHEEELVDEDEDVLYELVRARLLRRDPRDYHETYHLSKTGRLVLAKEG